jgi:hypothetical protein
MTVKEDGKSMFSVSLLYKSRRTKDVTAQETMNYIFLVYTAK